MLDAETGKEDRKTFFTGENEQTFLSLLNLIEIGIIKSLLNIEHNERHAFLLNAVELYWEMSFTRIKNEIGGLKLIKRMWNLILQGKNATSNEFIC